MRAEKTSIQMNINWAVDDSTARWEAIEAIEQNVTLATEWAVLLPLHRILEIPISRPVDAAISSIIERTMKRNPLHQLFVKVFQFWRTK